MEYEKVVRPGGASFVCFLRQEQGFGFCWHYHPEYELVYILAGRGVRYVGDGIANYQAGDLVLVGGNVPHSWKSEEGGVDRAVVVQFSGDFLGAGFFDRQEMRLIRELLAEAVFGVQFLCDGVGEKVAKLIETDGFERVLAFLEILHVLSCTRAKRVLSSRVYDRLMKRVEQDRFERVFDFVNRHYQEQVGLSEAAEAAGMSVSYFCAFFKRATGRTFMGYVNDLRVHRACTLLSETDRRIVDICFESGFENVSNFNRQFSRRKGISPRAYRRCFKDKG